MLWTVREAGPYNGANDNLKQLDKLEFKYQKKCFEGEFYGTCITSCICGGDRRSLPAKDKHRPGGHRRIADPCPDRRHFR